MPQNLSEKEINEKYEDLLFTKVMALYAEEKSEKILSEIEDEEPADPKKIEKIYSKTERRENLSVFWKISKKLITVAAMVVFVAVISISSVVVASANARTAVAETLYKMLYETTEHYTEINSEDPLTYDKNRDEMVGKYVPTYIPEGFEMTEKYDIPGQYIAVYSKGEKSIIFMQTSPGSYRVDSENAQVMQDIIINDSEALLIVKDGLTTVCLNGEKIMLLIMGDTDTYTTLEFAEGIKQIT